MYHNSESPFSVQLRVAEVAVVLVTVKLEGARQFTPLSLKATSSMKKASPVGSTLTSFLYVQVKVWLPAVTSKLTFSQASCAP